MTDSNSIKKSLNPIKISFFKALHHLEEFTTTGSVFDQDVDLYSSNIPSGSCFQALEIGLNAPGYKMTAHKHSPTWLSNRSSITGENSQDRSINRHVPSMLATITPYK